MLSFFLPSFLLPFPSFLPSYKALTTFIIRPVSLLSYEQRTLNLLSSVATPTSPLARPSTSLLFSPYIPTLDTPSLVSIIIPINLFLTLPERLYQRIGLDPHILAVHCLSGISNFNTLVLFTIDFNHSFPCYSHSCLQLSAVSCDVQLEEPFITRLEYICTLAPIFLLNTDDHRHPALVDVLFSTLNHQSFECTASRPTL